jgi:hypothetical protein
MKIIIDPEISMCDQKVNIAVSGLPPSGKVKIEATMCFPWAAGAKFKSYASFTADEMGNVDLAKQKPDSGSYDNIDSMGLIKSGLRANEWVI